MFERASALRPEDYQAPGFLAQALGSLGLIEERDAGLRRALKLMEDRLELNPDDARAANLAAAFLARLGDLSKAVEYAAGRITCLGCASINLKLVRKLSCSAIRLW